MFYHPYRIKLIRHLDHSVVDASIRASTHCSASNAVVLASVDATVPSITRPFGHRRRRSVVIVCVDAFGNSQETEFSAYYYYSYYILTQSNTFADRIEYTYIVGTIKLGISNRDW